MNPAEMAAQLRALEEYQDGQRAEMAAQVQAFKEMKGVFTAIVARGVFWGGSLLLLAWYVVAALIRMYA